MQLWMIDMTKCELVIRAKVKWWLKLYLSGLSMVCWLTGNNPDWNKVNAWVERGIKFEQV